MEYAAKTNANIAGSGDDLWFVRHSYVRSWLGMASGYPQDVTLFDESQWRIIRFCAEECKRQESGELSVEWMLSAWEYTMSLAPAEILPETVQHIGALVEPRKNTGGFRLIPVFIGFDEMLKPYLVPRAMEMLCAHRQDMTPEEWYLEFERIHPFVDGNGRTGKCLYNVLCGTMGNPQFPPNFFGTSNP